MLTCDVGKAQGLFESVCRIDHEGHSLMFLQAVTGNKSIIFFPLSWLALPILDIARVLAPAALLWVIGVLLYNQEVVLICCCSCDVTTKKLLQEFARRLVDTLSAGVSEAVQILSQSCVPLHRELLFTLLLEVQCCALCMNKYGAWMSR